MSLRWIIAAACAGSLLSAAIVALAHERPASSHGVHGSIGDVDHRTAIALSEDESSFIHQEMRGFLESVREILDASIAGDRARLAEAARRAGLNGSDAEHIPKSLAPKLPPEFKKLGLDTHRGFDRIAHDVEQAGAIDRVPKQLSDLMGNCIACHATWRLVRE